MKLLTFKVLKLVTTSAYFKDFLKIPYVILVPKINFTEVNKPISLYL